MIQSVLGQTFQLSYHRFTNLREIFQGDLSRKLTIGLTSQDFEPLRIVLDDGWMAGCFLLAC